MIKNHKFLSLIRNLCAFTTATTMIPSYCFVNPNISFTIIRGSARMILAPVIVSSVRIFTIITNINHIFFLFIMSWYYIHNPSMLMHRWGWRCALVIITLVIIVLIILILGITICLIVIILTISFFFIFIVL